MSDSYAGLLLITYNDDLLLDEALKSLMLSIDYPTVILCLDIGSTDNTEVIMQEFRRTAPVINSNIIDVIFEFRPPLESLAETMNYGFAKLMRRQECEYIGWAHPDMTFEDGWLSSLVKSLQQSSGIGKVCSFNTRDGNPQFRDYIEGHEQCYLIRRGVLLKIGLFDTRFKGIGGHEDHDMNNRIRQEGWHVVISADSRVNHSAMATRSRRDTSEEQRYNAEQYYQKWGKHREIPFEELQHGVN